MEKQNGKDNVIKFRDTRDEVGKWQAASDRGGFANLSEFLRFAANYAVKKKVKNPLTL